MAAKISEATKIDDTERVDMPREETVRTSNAPDLDGKLKVDNILFIVVTVSIVTVSFIRNDDYTVG
jgi:hypothetical protein